MSKNEQSSKTNLVKIGVVILFAMLIIYQALIFVSRENFSLTTYTVLAILGLVAAGLLVRGWFNFDSAKHQ